MCVPNLQSCTILGVRVDDVTYDDTLQCVDRMVASGGIHQIATVNVEFIMEARKNPEFERVLAAASLCVPDGIGVLWASRRQGTPLRARVAGVDLVEVLAERAALQGWRVFFLGAALGVAERAATVLSERYAGLVIAGCHSGSPSIAEENAICERIRATQPDVLFVAYGAPNQDLWIARNQARIGVPVALGVGGSFDFICGQAKRAPAWVQRLGLEWLHRLLREPWRWRRQLVLPQFALRVLMNRGT